MVKTVETGKNVCTVVLNGEECAVSFADDYLYYSISNFSDDTVYASFDSNVTADADGVVSIPSGAVKQLAVCVNAPIQPMQAVKSVNSIFIVGNGKVMVEADRRPFFNASFKAAGKGGESINVSGEGNPVTLEGLQGGVPFADITVSGKNLLTYPYVDNSKTMNGITYTVNSDGSVIANGTATSASVFYFNGADLLPNCDYVLSGCPEGGGSSKYRIQFSNNSWSIIFADYGDGTKVRVDKKTTLQIMRIVIEKDTVCDNIVFRPQLELGSAPTEYEQPITGRELTLNANGIDYTITPDSNPYTIPNDIRQQDGLNNISVSAGELSVAGVRKNAAIKRIWDDMGMDLLFDGLARSDSPAVGLDFSGYSKFVVSNYYYVNKIDYSGTVLIEIDRLETLINDAGALDIPISTQYSVLNYFSGSISDASFYAVQSADASALYATRIYGIR